MTQRLIFSVLLLSSSLAHAAFTSFTGIDPTRVAATFNKAYIADGFDSNDLVQITGEGKFRNTCYRHAETSVKVDEVTQTIWLGPVAYEYSGLCLQVVLPFQRVIDVGLLKPGRWTVEQGKHERLGEFTVKAASSNSADDFLYAPISQAFFQSSAGLNEVLLSGDFPNDCMVFDSEKVSVQPDVIVIQPIARVENRISCKNGKFPFSKTVSIPAVPKGRYLLHVRSIGGNALNSMIDVN